MNARAPVVIACLLMGVPTMLFAITSWSLQPWGLATCIAVTLAIGAVGLAVSLYYQRKQQSR